MKLTPSHLALVKDRDNSHSGIKRIIVGDEALETNLALQVWKSFGDHVEIYNEYGPTEATVGQARIKLTTSSFPYLKAAK